MPVCSSYLILLELLELVTTPSEIMIFLIQKYTKHFIKKICRTSTDITIKLGIYAKLFVVIILNSTSPVWVPGTL